MPKQQRRWAWGGAPSCSARYLPNVLPVVLVLLSLEMGIAVIVEAILSFVGLSVSTDTPTWGGMIAEGRQIIYQAWWVLVFPLAHTVPHGSRLQPIGRRIAPVARSGVEAMNPVIDIRNLSAQSSAGPILRDVSLAVNAGEAMALVGESGAGKSTIAKAVLGILPAGIKVTSGEILFEGTDLLALPPARMRALLGVRIALIPQDPQTSLNPSRRIGDQLTDGLRLRAGMSKADARTRALELLNDVHIRDAGRVLERYPHELSGGMRQRVLIAQAFSLNPQVIIADEPTTALDVTVQKQVLRLIRLLQRNHGTTLLFVTHDLGVVAQICDRMTVLYGGKVLEQGATAEVLRNPQHRYTQALLAANPRYDRPDQSLKPVPEELIAELNREISV